MSTLSYLKEHGQYPLTNVPITENLLLELTHDNLSCPFCERKSPDVTTWGSYPTNIGEIRRYYCYVCKKTFNPSKIPKIYEKMGKIAFELGKLIFKTNTSINSLSELLEVPQSTLRSITAEIESRLSENFEFIKSLDQVLTTKKTINNKSMRILYYDEGFHRLLGTQYYLIFAVDEFGVPIQAEISSSKSKEDIRDVLEQAITNLGGIDVIVADGSPTILSAIRGMYRSLLLVQQIHSDDGKRARIIQLDPVLGTKKMREMTIELHTESLKFNKESEIKAVVKEIYPSQRRNKLQHQKDPFFKKKQEIVENGKFDSENNPRNITKEELKKKRRAKLLTGYTLHLQTYNELGQLAISFTDTNQELINGEKPNLLEIYNIITKVQTVFPDLFITSNRAEQFNSVHDRGLSYRGRITQKNANKKLKSWILYKYYKKGVERFLIKEKFNIPYSILQKTYQLQIKEVNFV